MSSAANEQQGMGSIARLVIESPGAANGLIEGAKREHLRVGAHVVFSAGSLAAYGPPRARSVKALEQLPEVS